MNTRYPPNRIKAYKTCQPGVGTQVFDGKINAYFWFHKEKRHIFLRTLLGCEAGANKVQWHAYAKKGVHDTIKQGWR